MAIVPGQRIGRYTIERLLGEGAMGRVYRARDHQLERTVALKVLRIDEDAPDDEKEHGGARLLREARAAATLEHVNAVTIHDVGELDGQPFLAMELVEGTSLRSYVGDLSVPVQTRVRWLVDVAQALAAAHARGLIHRDVKPENVMLRRDGVIKVLDFGIARRATSEEKEAAPVADGDVPFDLGTLEGAIVGTPRYMAPEQLRGEPVDARADQFAWGVMAYELLVGQPPWEGSPSSFTLLATIVSDDAVPMEPLAAACSPEVVAVVARALAKHREDRFPSMLDIASALQESTSVPSRPSATELPERRSRWRLGLMAAVLLLGAGLTTARVLTRPSPEPGLTSPARMTDFAVTTTTNAEAKNAFLEGVTLLHDGSVVPGVRALLRALKADPSLVEARVRLLAYGRDLGEVDEREHFEKAWDVRARLSERDRALLTALSPLFLAIPPDKAEATKRFTELAAKRPFDAELAYLSAVREDDSAKQVSLLQKVLVLDPEFSLALWRKSVMDLTAGSYEEALRSLDQCIRVTPASTACLSVRLLVEEETGRCEAMEKDARVLEARSPSARTHDWVARVLMARGAPLASVQDALERKWQSATDAERAGFRLTDEEHLAEARGDFLTAEARAQAQAARVEPSLVEDDHKSVAWGLVNLYTEMGDTVRAATVADLYLKARSAWQSSGAWSVEPVFWGAAVRGGLRTDAERRIARDAWMKTWDSEQSQFRPQGWLLGYAEPAETEAEAREAMSAAPSPLPRAHTNQFNRTSLGTVGKVLLLAGQPQLAVPELQRAASTCSLLSAPLGQTRSYLLLGEALEKTSDVRGACAAYHVVLQRWGNAKPRSVSAERARERVASLTCPP